jgi:NADH-quinone oxidoreductase subunit F
MEFSKAVLTELESVCSRYPKREAALLPALRLLEREFGSISDDGMKYVAKLIGVPPAKVFGVVTFYTHYKRAGEGKYQFQVCATLPCALRGGLDLYHHLSKSLGITHGQTTPEGLFTLKKVECLADCDKAPCLQVNEDYFDKVRPEDTDRMISQMRRAEWTVQIPPYTVPKTKYPPVLLEHVQEDGSFTLENYEKRGGYQQAARVFTSMKAPDLIEFVKKSGLRGRGGAGFPTGMKWGFVPAASPKPKYLVCNDDESEPGTFKDKMLTERDPHRVLEGIQIGSFAIQAHDAYIYIRGEFGRGAKVLNAAIQEAYAKGLFGKDLFGTGYRLDVTLHRGAGAYICGEETGLLSSLEGGRGEPRLKPPFPAVSGLYGCPTIINNVETLCNVPFIVDRGADWFLSIGTEKSPGTKIFCLCGHVERPGLYEVPLGIPLREMIFDLGGGIPGGRKLKAVIPGGSSAAVLTADEIDVKMDFDSLAAAKTMLGSGGVIVMDDTTCMVGALWNVLRFYHHESCGQCTPCREGTGWLDKILGRLETGRGTAADLGVILEVCDEMVGRTICVLADAAAMPAKSIVQKFKAEFEAHVTEKRCPFKAKGSGTAALPAHVTAGHPS